MKWIFLTKKGRNVFEKLGGKEHMNALKEFKDEFHEQNTARFLVFTHLYNMHQKGNIFADEETWKPANVDSVLKLCEENGYITIVK